VKQPNFNPPLSLLIKGGLGGINWNIGIMVKSGKLLLRMEQKPNIPAFHDSNLERSGAEFIWSLEK
jgi:hypothetical protein